MTFLKRSFNSKLFRRGITIGFILFGLTALYILVQGKSLAARFSRIDAWLANPASRSEWGLRGGIYCGDAPMMFPSDGFIGVSWNDGVAPLYQHTGLDIFSPDGADNVTPIYAAYDGYLTREAHWRSAVIIRHPDFNELPHLTNGEQIWSYYTHMASRDGESSFIAPDFPPGTYEKFVEAGDLLGYQGSWSGSDNFNIARHLHFSIVKSYEDGGYANETRIRNTYNPLPFLGLVRDENGSVTCRQSTQKPTELSQKIK